MQTILEKFKEIDEYNKSKSEMDKRLKKGFVFYLSELKKPMYMEINSGDCSMELNVYDVSCPTQEIENHDILSQKVKDMFITKSDEILISDEPVATLGSSYFKCSEKMDSSLANDYFCINDIRISDPKLRRKGLGTFLRRTAEDISCANDITNFYARRDENKDKEIRSRKPSFLNYFFNKNDYAKFLISNGFYVDPSPYQLPVKHNVYRKGILRTDMCSLDPNVANATNKCFQIFDESFSFDKFKSGQDMIG